MPYTYLIHHKPTGLKYYGVRYASGAEPADLWKLYFTSSRQVKELISLYGADSFEVEIRRTFSCAKAAIEWENKVIRRLSLIKRRDWLNETNGSSHKAAKRKTEEHRRRISEANKGQCSPKKREVIFRNAELRRGSSLSEKTKENMRVAHSDMVWIFNPETKKNKMVKRYKLGKYPTWEANKRSVRKSRVFSDEAKQNMSAARKGKFTWVSDPKSQHSKQVKIQDLPKYLGEGWIVGRKFGMANQPSSFDVHSRALKLT